MWPFQFVVVWVCGRLGLWPFRSVAVPVCGRFGLWPFRSVAVPVCDRFGLWPFRFWPFRFVAVMSRIRKFMVTLLQKLLKTMDYIYIFHSHIGKLLRSPRIMKLYHDWPWWLWPFLYQMVLVSSLLIYTLGKKRLFHPRTRYLLAIFHLLICLWGLKAGWLAGFIVFIFVVCTILFNV